MRGVGPWSVKSRWSRSFVSWHGISGGRGSRTWWRCSASWIPLLWRRVDHNPVEFLKRLPAEQLERRAAELALDSRIDYAFRRLSEYLRDTDSWGSVQGIGFAAAAGCYFSAEFGLHESLPIYSGGLGVLAGDHLKSASDLGIPLVGVGLLYAQGYFRQTLDSSGWQQELYLNADLELLPIESVAGPDGKPLLVAVETTTGVLHARVWRVEVGRTTLLLLDSNVPREQRLGPLADGAALRRRRAGADPSGASAGGRRASGRCTRFRSSPAVLHLNEGHSAFATLEMIRSR